MEYLYGQMDLSIMEIEKAEEDTEKEFFVCQMDLYIKDIEKMEKGMDKDLGLGRMEDLIMVSMKMI